MKTNIFGKTPLDYTHLQDAKQADPVMYNALLKDGWSGKGHKFNAVGNTFGLIKDKQSFSDNAAQGVTWLSYNVEAMQAEIQEILYSEYRLDEYFPTKTAIPEGAKSFYYRVVDKQGRGAFIDNFGGDGPTAGVTAQRVNYTMNRGGIIAQWSDEDLREAIFGGIPLDTETLEAATEGCMDHIEQVGLGTDPEQRFEGLLNMQNVTVDVAATPWNAGTPDAAIKAITQPIATIIKNTNEIFGRKIKTPMGLYVSIELADYLQNTRLDTVTSSTIWDFLRTNNLWTQYTGLPLELIMVQELSTASSTQGNRALYGFPKSTKVWEMGMSISPRVMFIDRMPYYYQAPMEYKISGLNVYRPGGMLYVDNVYA